MSFINSAQPNISFFPFGELSIRDIGIYTERSIMDDYNLFLINYISTEKSFFESVVLNEDDIKAITKNDDNQESSDNKEETSSEEKSNNKSNNDVAKKGFAKSIAEWLKTIWEKIKGFFVKLIEKVKSIYDDWKKKNDVKIADKFVEAINNINDKDFSVKLFSQEYIQTIISNCSLGPKLIQQYTLEAEKDYSNNIDPATFKEKYDKDALVKRLYNNDTLSYDSLQSIPKFFNLICKFKRKEQTAAVNKQVHGDTFNEFSEYANIDEIKRDKNLIVNIAFNNNKWIQVLNKNYNDCKSFVDSCMKGANNMLKTLDEDADNKVLLKEFITGANNCILVLMKLSAISNVCLQNIRLNYLSCVSQCITQAKKESKA